MPPSSAEVLRIAREVREINKALDARRRVVEAEVDACADLLARRKPLDFALREVPPRFLRTVLKEEGDGGDETGADDAAVRAGLLGVLAEEAVPDAPGG